MQNHLQAYQQRTVQTAGPGQLLLMLFDGAIRFLKEAILAIDKGDITLSHAKINRVQDIVNELNITLDRNAGGEIAQNLTLLYEYIGRRLVEADIQKNGEILKEIIDLLQELRGGFAEATKAVAGKAIHQVESRQKR